MTILRNLLFGTAAGFVAVAGAQAADMPVKAAPVQYMKICSLYGDGFYYIPGTDTCLKIGGFVRLQTEFGSGSSGIVQGQGNVLVAARYDRQDTNDVNFTSRAVITADARTQTEYGTLRSYFRAGWDVRTPDRSGAGTGPCNNGAANNCLGWWDRAFIQFAGFTVGRAQSFFDLFTYFGTMSYLSERTDGHTPETGATVWAYTATFGNGFSATLSAEDPNAHNKGNTFDITRAGYFAINGGTSNDNAFNLQGGVVNNNGWRMPDVILNFRIDQAWGFFGVSAVIHDVSGAYWAEANNVNNGHPADKVGWAFGIGGQLNLQGGDQVGANFVYAKGATGYTGKSASWQIYNASTSVGVGWAADGLFTTGGEIELTESWSVNAGYQHMWNPRWRTSWYGGFTQIRYNDTEKGLINSTLPAGSVCLRTVAGVVGNFAAFTPLAGNSCNPDYSYYQVGSRTQWNPTPLLDIGLDVYYTKLNTAYKGTAVYAANAPRPAVGLIDDQSVWSALFRWQRNFYP